MQNWLSSNIVAFIILITVSFISPEIKKITWDDLSHVTYRETFSPEHDVFYPKPIFSLSIKKLNHTLIEISGIAMKIDSIPNHYFLLQDEDVSSKCYGYSFKNATIDISLRDEKIKLNPSNLITLRGKLILHDDPDHLPYLLYNAELVE